MKKLVLIFAILFLEMFFVSCVSEPEGESVFVKKYSSSSRILSSSSLQSVGSSDILCVIGTNCVYIDQLTCLQNGTPVDVCPVSSSSSSLRSSSSAPPVQPSSSSTPPVSGGYTGPYGSLPYEGKTYKTVVIGTQTWMAENLNYNAEGSKCYDNQDSNCNTYGRLYNWATAITACPGGWHLPSDAEWSTLENSVGGSSTAGKHLKATNGWNAYEGQSGNGLDTYGFTALPGGGGDSGGNFYYVGYYGYWWSSAEFVSNYAYGRYMDYDGEDVIRYGSDKDGLFSVRCVQD